MLEKKDIEKSLFENNNPQTTTPKEHADKLLGILTVVHQFNITKVSCILIYYQYII